ncbi:MAG: hypothetical protein M3004_01810, partial [Bacteroidota bacterium]|nr:hypothetical protein [Bacteroidota bacterium]
GSNPLRSYLSRPRDYGFTIGSGNKAKCLNASFVAAYELKENLFVEGTVLLRHYSTALPTSLSGNTSMLTLGIRWNLFRREYDY